MSKTKILLLELPIDSWNRFGKHYLPNPGILAIGTYLKVNGYDVKIIDTYAEGIGWNDIKKVIIEERPDIIGSSTYTPDIYGRVLLARIIKQIDPKIKVVFGGIHVTLMPEETLRLAKDIDYVITGEGEETFLELIKAIERGENKEKIKDIKGLSFIHDGQYIETPQRPLISDINLLPLPDYSMIPMDKYVNNYFPYSGKAAFSCYFSRGCSSRCNFCSENILWQYKWRGRNAKNIVKELSILNKDYGKKAFLFNDDNFLLDRKRNIEFIDEMGKSGLNVDFRVGARVDTLLRDKDMLEDLRKVGLIALQIGVESFGQGTLNDMNKNYQIDKLKELSHVLKKAKIPFPRLFLIIGNLNDDKRSIKNIIKNTKECGFASIQISTLTPWPGTEFYKNMEKSKILKNHDYRSYDFKHTLMPTNYLSMRQIDKLRTWLFYMWHLDFWVIIKSLQNKYLRHFYFYTMFSLHKSAIVYKFIHYFNFWKLFKHNRMIDNIQKEHAELQRHGNNINE